MITKFFSYGRRSIVVVLEGCFGADGIISEGLYLNC